MKYKTHCSRGHERTPENLHTNGACKICTREYQRAPEYKARQREYDKRKNLNAERKKPYAIKRRETVTAERNKMAINKKQVVIIPTSKQELLDAEQRAVDRAIDAKYWQTPEPCKSLKAEDPEYFYELKRMYEARA